jgi:hypothetical protein
MRTTLRCIAAAAALLLGLGATARPVQAQSATLLRLQSGSPAANRLVIDSAGGVLLKGFVRDVGGTTGCAAFIPATGAGTRFMWHPCRGSLRFGRATGTEWDDVNMDDFTFAGGNQVTANGYGAFAFGDQVTVSSTVGVGFGSGVTVSGTAGFSAGASNKCTGFACTAIGYTVTAGGQGSVALGYRTTANNDYSVAIGYRASNNTHTGTMAMGDESTTDSVRNQFDNEFRARYNGGFKFRTSAAANSAPGIGGNTGCDLPTGSGTFVCSSSRTIKHGFLTVDGEDVLTRLANMPVTSWVYNNEPGDPRHLGPVAEDFHDAFGLGDSDKSVGLTDLSGVALASAKALELRTRELRDAQTALAAKQEKLAEQTGRVTALENELRTLRADRAESDVRTAARLAALEMALSKIIAPRQ